MGSCSRETETGDGRWGGGSFEYESGVESVRASQECDCERIRVKGG